MDVGKVYFSVCQKVSMGIKSYLFAAFLYPYNGRFVLSRLVVKPFIFGDIWRLKSPYISNFCVIAGRVFYLEENYSLDGVLSGGEDLLTLCLSFVGVNSRCNMHPLKKSVTSVQH